ncbi:carboxypeptidase-like regulatory domain-containing protein [Shewanella zhangzhouensis]|uniref:carboxypeptidase-like regulatory domain-containing protein n=1 Tax=Shewanella zhangzhouensis TaxID=2864213 RepID=UPI001C65A4FF|nr:carboxypeptidase-like regulatory domain-containing protein [Shewanella zhangzhouensis]QYK04737.1 carboxypeptidase-like regulatory domain-containing protein [Shewanella zhangzhouensis]
MQVKSLSAVSGLSALALCTGLAFSGAALAEQIKIQNVHFDADSNQLSVKAKIDGHHHGQDSAGDAYIEIVDAANPGFVLSAFQTPKQIHSKIDAASLAFLPCQVGIVVNGDTANMAVADVKNVPTSCGGFAATITGLITDEPIPYATVSVTLNGNTFTTVADENGAYSLDVLTTNIEQLLLIESSATNAETGDSIDFVNLVGSFSKVLSEDDPINVTNVTTAKYSLVLEANGGEQPSTLAELEQAETAVDATELFQLAAIIKLIVDDPGYQLPEGYDSILDFIADEGAVDTFVASTPPEALEQALADILADSELVAGFSAADVPSLYYAISTTSPGYLARSGSALEFDNVGMTGKALSFQQWNGQPISQDFSWAVVSGRIEVSYSAPLVTEELSDSIEYVTDNQAEIDAYYAGGGAVENFITHRTLTQRAYTRVVDGSLVDVVSVESRSELSTPPIPLSDGSFLTIAQPKLVLESGNENFRANYDINNIPFVSGCSEGDTCVSGLWAGQYHYTDGERVYDDYVFPHTAYADAMQFVADGSVSGKISNVNASWVVDGAGRLVITYPDGMIQTSQILDKLGIELGVFSVFENAGERFAVYDIWIKGDANLQLGVAGLQPSTPSHFWVGEINSWLPGSVDAMGLLHYQRLWGWQFGASEVQNTYAIGDWSAPDGDGLSSVPFTQDAPVPYAVTADYVRISRFPFAERYWYPINSQMIDGDRVFYVVEREVRDGDVYGRAPGYRTFIPARINIERERDMADYTNVAR